MSTTPPEGSRQGTPGFPSEAAVFGRPERVGGSFGPRQQPPDRRISQQPVVSDMLAEAFGRPAPAAPGLERPAADTAPNGGAEADPGPQPGDEWRDPQAPVVLGEPAQQPEGEPAVQRAPAPRFTLRQALFRRRLRPSALIALAVCALLIGAVGAVIGGLLVRGDQSTSAADVNLATVNPDIERPAGSVADVAKRITPAVVSLEVRVGNTGDTGSGVVIDSSGHILTNNHVVSMASDAAGAKLTVVFSGGARVAGSIVGRDPASDLAVVKVNPPEGMTVAPLGNSDKLAVGDPVIAVGSPLGLQSTVTTGIVSAVQRPLRLSGEGTDTNAVIDAVQTDAAVNPGNSGGPLIDAAGAVIGINTAIRTLGEATNAGSIGLGFAIPINDARAVAQELIKTGKMQHPSLGVNAKSVTDGTTDGAQVQNVQTGGPAERAGIAEGDVIVKVGGRSVGNADELVVAVQEHPVGATVPVELTRAGRTMTVQVTLSAAQS
ncbi:S1C family serine protease [Nakamurella aerolata]|uniref:PDZ domain-containing protein n=1 Tax=Nakamurella aerolata TaxID=1656892 RepID=A0A849A3C8_9ACTN|nr:trypsin-like peptidase domain-containing protein [Nakamurella aerolata]NNG34186.1 PDZ domain-containing protein [Nakamurella aerolata]